MRGKGDVFEAEDGADGVVRVQAIRMSLYELSQVVYSAIVSSLAPFLVVAVANMTLRTRRALTVHVRTQCVAFHAPGQRPSR
jgi:ABC-type maltose transport system permease subunit